MNLVPQLTRFCLQDMSQKNHKMEQLRIGVVGYCPPARFDFNEAKRMLVDGFNYFERRFPNIEFSVVSGLTDIGIASLAYREAKKRGWKTSGIGCSKAKEYPCFPVDEKPIIIGDNWGDESETFLNSIDALIRIGGGIQSHLETQEAKKKNIQVLEYELEAYLTIKQDLALMQEVMEKIKDIDRLPSYEEAKQLLDFLEYDEHKENGQNGWIYFCEKYRIKRGDE